MCLSRGTCLSVDCVLSELQFHAKSIATKWQSLPSVYVVHLLMLHFMLKATPKYKWQHVEHNSCINFYKVCSNMVRK
jgi:hypothetical protein